MKSYKLMVTGILAIASLAPALSGGPEGGKRPEGGESPLVSPLVGTWFHSLSMRGDCPTNVRVVTINAEGVYHWVEIGMIPNVRGGDEDPWTPVGAEVSHLTGTINLETGEEKVDPERISVSFVGISWGIKDGKLWRVQDMGTMGSDGVSFTRELR